MAIEDYENATVQELQQEIVEGYRQQKIQENIDNVVKNFVSYRTIAKEKFLKERDAELQAILAEWQGYEDDNHTIPQEVIDELDAYNTTE